MAFLKFYQYLLETNELTHIDCGVVMPHAQSFLMSINLGKPEKQRREKKNQVKLVVCLSQGKT